MKSGATIHFKGPEDPGRGRARATTLPLDILAGASNRLAWLALMYGTGLILVYGLFSLTDPNFVRRESFVTEVVTVGICSAMAIAVFFITRMNRLSPHRLIDLGLLFEVVGGFGISFVEHWALFGARPFDGFGISWIALWVATFPLVVPSTPGKTLLAAIVTASTGVLAFTISVAAGKSPPQSFEVWVRLFGPSYIATVWAFLAAKVVYKLGSDVKEARRMGAYELLERLGSGGMGEVWRARHRFLSRPAAIKLISPASLGEMSGSHAQHLRQRFEREAQATATLSSPNSIVLYDFGTTDEGVFYYVMELLRGVDLQQMVERFGPLPAPRVVFLLKQACNSLIDAHMSGLIHRDIKPANIYLCRLGAQADFVKVLDFGLVKMQSGSHRFESGSTATSMISGTPGYMAPEVILGTQDFEPCVDIYSLGCVAYWLLCGRPVFEEDTVERLLRCHVTKHPVPPSSRCEMDIPKPLEELVLRCLARERCDRVPSAADLLASLEELDGFGTWTNESAMRWWNSHLPVGAEAWPTVKMIST